MVDCPDANEIVRILDGEALDPETARAFDEHLGACNDCRVLVAELGHSLELDTLAEGSDGAPETWELVSGAEVVSRGAQIDRYVVLDAIGAGAMGVVYRAYDPDLDRDVALKLVRVLDGRIHGERARARLLREAQAMARLAHPNVVAVYDASVVGTHVFLAMELVGGRDLETVLASGAVRGGWRAIVRMFVEAGRGLAAAHAAGIVHRDFKPSNVLVGDDGRIRVTDFGLAAGDGESPGPPHGGDPDARLTDPETLVGTPAYMSPEVRAGTVADARSDQYSFAIALCEAITGERAPTAQLPAPLRRVVGRALAQSPEDRHPSMTDFTAALERASRPPLVRALPMIAVGSIAVAAGAGYLFASRTHGIACPAPTAQLAGLWDEARAVEVRRAFLATGHPLAPAHWPPIANALDRASRRWSASHVAACEATHVRHEQSEVMLDRRMRCLHAERIRLTAVVDMLAHPDREVVTRALDAVELEGRIARCDDPDPSAVVTAGVAAPSTRDDAAMRALADAEIELVRAHYPQATRAAERIAQEAHLRGELRLEAEATRIVAEARWRGGDPAGAEPVYYRTLDLAKQAGAPDVEADVLLQLVAVVGFEAGRRAEGLQLARIAEATARAIHDDGRLARVLGNRAAIEFAQANYPAARADWEIARATFERIYGPRDRRVGMTLMNLGNLAATSGEGDALALFDRAKAVLEGALSPGHPEVARLLGLRAMSLARVDRFDDAVADLERARTIYLAVLGPDHVDVSRQLLARARVEAQRGAFAAALVHYRDALAGFERATPPTSPLRAFALAGIGGSLVELGRFAEARAPLEQVLVRWAGEEATTDRATAELALARVLWEDGRDRPRALELATHAATTYDTGVRQRAEAWLRGKRGKR